MKTPQRPAWDDDPWPGLNPAPVEPPCLLCAAVVIVMVIAIAIGLWNLFSA